MSDITMVVVDGIRYRPEDAPARPTEEPPAPTGPPAPPAVTEPAGPLVLFDPAEHTVPEVLEHLAAADEDETERVLAAELAGPARKGIVGPTAQAGGDGGATP
ncbi:hypothetical protein [Kitasatospora purpeofusca]|uniref:hypothetical protein n=1 Tax=Kitasatospora purpeofusca TaxID=67352 RepID=UPI0036B118E8